MEVLKKSGKEFKYSVEWGSDLQTEHGLGFDVPGQGCYAEHLARAFTVATRNYGSMNVLVAMFVEIYTDLLWLSVRL